MLIDNLIHQPEGKTLEFKRDFSSSKPLLKTLIAFANTAGGRLIIGIDDNRKVIGVDQPLDEEERLCNLIADSIVPRLVPNVELMTFENKTLLIIEVFVSNIRPHWLKTESEEHGVYVRLGSTNRKADLDLIKELYRSTTGTPFDEMPMPDLSIEDLDLKTAQDLFANIGISTVLTEQTLLTLKLLTRYQSRLVPTHGAMLLFGKQREYYFSDAWVQCGRFIGKDKAAIFDHIDIHENLPKSVESMMLFLKKHAMRGADFSEIQRKDIWSIPLTMLREAIINALIHSDYSQRGAPIRVSFFDDRIEIENPGILLSGMTIEDMLQGVSKIRNHVIARIFKELSLIEQWGSGVKRIFKEAEDLKLPKPQIIEIGMRVRMIIFLAEPINIVEPRLEPRLESRLESELATNILLYLKNNDLSKSDLAKALGHQTISGELNKQIQVLLSHNLIVMTIPEKPNSRMQKYHLINRSIALDSRLESRPESRLESELATNILLYLKNNDLSKSDLAKALGHQTISGELNKQIQVLLSHNLIVMTIPEKPNSRMQKYRLTHVGRNYIKNMT